MLDWNAILTRMEKRGASYDALLCMMNERNRYTTKKQKANRKVSRSKRQAKKARA